MGGIELFIIAIVGMLMLLAVAAVVIIVVVVLRRRARALNGPAGRPPNRP